MPDPVTQTATPATVEVLLDGAALDALVAELTGRIAAEVSPLSSLALVGLPTRGVPLARRIAERLRAAHGTEVPPVGQIDVTFHRDDLDRRLPIPRQSEIPFDAAGRHLVLVDDVLFTGRTVRAALTALMDFGRPASIRLLALVDRGHRQLPIQADFVGRRIVTAAEDQVAVKLAEIDGVDAVEVIRA